MPGSTASSQPKEHRTLHALIAICVLVIAQINLMLHPQKSATADDKDGLVLDQAAKPQKIVQPAKAEPAKSTPVKIADAALLDVIDSSPPAQTTASPATAFTLMREGNQYISKRSQGKLVQMISDRSDGTTPTDWRVVYYDPEARYKAVEVRFSCGEMTRVFEPGRFLELFSRRAHEPIKDDLLHVDSDEAISIALRRAGLTEEMASETELKLETGENGVPVWKVNFWGRVQHRDANLGEIIISAVDGSVVKNRIKAAPIPDRLTQADSKMFLQKRL